MEGSHLINQCFDGPAFMQLRYLQQKDLGSFETLFEHCFEHAPTPGLWDYKFNADRGFSLGLFQKHNNSTASNDSATSAASADTSLVAHYGGIKRDILFEGNPHVALQIGDVMVNTSVINSLARKGPFFQIATAFFARTHGLRQRSPPWFWLSQPKGHENRLPPWYLQRGGSNQRTGLPSHSTSPTLLVKVH